MRNFENFLKKLERRKMENFIDKSWKKSGNERKAVCKNKNKSFYLFLRRKSAREKTFITFYSAEESWSNFEESKKEKFFDLGFSSIAPANCRESFSCACRWNGNFSSRRMKFYDAAFVFLFRKRGKGDRMRRATHKKHHRRWTFAVGSFIMTRRVNFRKCNLCLIIV